MKLLNFGKCRILRGGGDSSSSVKSALRRGFTIMELVIVIAVIAVLAAVLIPTFANLTQRANESADMQTVENLNTILISEETISGEKPATMSEAIAQAASGGYNVAALSPTSDGNDILWDQTSNRFVLADGETGEIIHKDDATAATETDNGFWKIYSSEEEINADETEDGNKYSIYLADDFTFSGERALTVTAGVDVGNNSDIDVSYADNVAETVVFNMNGGDLSVDNEEGTQSFYGTANALTVTATDPENCMHVYGVVNGEVTVNQGRINIANSAIVNNSIVVSNTTGNVIVSTEVFVTIIIESSTDNNVNIEANTTVYVDNQSTGNNVTLPDNVQTPVEISSVDSLTETIKLDADEYGYSDTAYLLNSGLYKLTADIVVEHQIFIAEGSNVVLDLNGHKIESQFIGISISNHGNLTVNDSSDGNGIIYNSTNKNNEYNYGHDALRNFGILIVNGGTFGDKDTDRNNENDCTYGAAIRNMAESSCVINGGYFTCVDNYGEWEGGGQSYSYAIRSAGNMTINYAYVYGRMNGCISADAGHIDINDGYFTLSGTNTYYILVNSTSAGGTTTVNGGTFDRKDIDRLLGGFSGMPSWDASESLASNGFVINGGTFISNDETVNLG